MSAKRHPLHAAAVAAVLQNPGVLGLKSKRLRADICARFDMSQTAAWTVLEAASQAVRNTTATLSLH